MARAATTAGAEISWPAISRRPPRLHYHDRRPHGVSAAGPASEHRLPFARTKLSTGISAFDGLLGGGVDTGSSTLILGPAGTGKSLIAINFAMGGDCPRREGGDLCLR